MKLNDILQESILDEGNRREKVNNFIRRLVGHLKKNPEQKDAIVQVLTDQYRKKRPRKDQK